MTDRSQAARKRPCAPPDDGGLPVAFSPLPWYATGDGFDFANGLPLAEIYREIRAAGFGAVPAEPPEGMTPTAYRELLTNCELVAAPGYFQAPLSDPQAATACVESARRTAAWHAELGMTRIFAADRFGAPPRVENPGVGAGQDPARLNQIIETLTAVASAMTKEGVTPCLHQHIGTWIETPDETAAILDALDPELLLFGPDTGHLGWAGADLNATLHRYRDRVGAVHLKDLRTEVTRTGGNGRGYRELVREHAWTEPGRGNLELDGVLRELSGYEGWFVIEVDVADQPSPSQSAAASAEWARLRLAGWERADR